MVFNGFASPFIAVIDPNSFGLIQIHLFLLFPYLYFSENVFANGKFVQKRLESLNSLRVSIKTRYTSKPKVLSKINFQVNSCASVFWTLNHEHNCQNLSQSRILSIEEVIFCLHLKRCMTLQKRIGKMHYSLTKKEQNE